MRLLLVFEERIGGMLVYQALPKVLRNVTDPNKKSDVPSGKGLRVYLANYLTLTDLGYA